MSARPRRIADADRSPFAAAPDRPDCTGLFEPLEKRVRPSRASGVYHRARPDVAPGDAVAEANWFLSKSAPYLSAGWLRPVVDVEGVSGMTNAALSQWIVDFNDTVVAATGVEPIVYVNTDYATTRLDASVAGYDLWVANWSSAYGTPQAGSPPTGVWGGSNGGWDFWQYSCTGSVDGIVGPVCLNVLDGDAAALDQYRIAATPGVSFQLSADFGPAGSAVPDGYVGIANQTFGTVAGLGGQTYQMGWNSPGVAATARTPTNAPDGRFSDYAQPNTFNGASRSFEVAVPNGRYRVRAVAGSPDQVGSTHKFFAEGTPIVSGVNNSTSPFLTGVATVDVTDGRLTISSDAATAPFSRLNFLDVVAANRTASPPAGPSGVTVARPTATTATVTWTDNADNEGRDPASVTASTIGQVNQGYRVERREWSAGEWSAWAVRGHSLANATSYADAGLTGGTPTQFRVVAVNGAGESPAAESESSPELPPAVASVEWTIFDPAAPVAPPAMSGNFTDGGTDAASGGNGVVDTKPAGQHVLRLNADHDERAVGPDGRPVPDLATDRLADADPTDHADHELLAGTVRLTLRRDTDAGSRAVWGIALPDGVQLWQWWGAEGNAEGDPVHPTKRAAHWGKVISGDYSRPDLLSNTAGNDRYQYRIEGTRTGLAQEVVVWMYDADRKGVPDHGDPAIEPFGPGIGDSPPPDAVGTLLFDVLHADLDGDTDGDGVLSRSPEEEAAEDGPYAARVMLPLDLTSPGELSGTTVADASAAGYDGPLVPLVLELPEPIDPSKADIAIGYGPHDPFRSPFYSDGSDLVWNPADFGYLRIWKSWDGDTRKLYFVDHPHPYRGELIPPHRPVTAASLGFSSEQRTVTVWVEALARRPYGANEGLVTVGIRPDRSPEPGSVNVPYLYTFDTLSVETDVYSALDPNDDEDGDGLTNEQEREAGTDPFGSDSDGDLLPDDWEVRYSPPFDPTEPDAADADGNGVLEFGDEDMDGLDDLDESVHDTDPTNPDTDGDGASDPDEAAQGSDPTDPADGGKPPADDMLAWMDLAAGDDSGSHHERWRLDVGRYNVTAPDYGKVGIGTYAFERGESYPVGLHFVARNQPAEHYDEMSIIAEGGTYNGLPNDWIQRNEPRTNPAPVTYFIIDPVETGPDAHPVLFGGYRGPESESMSARLVFPLLDADVDSDNDAPDARPAHTREEDRLEQEGGEAKTLAANTGDLDADGVPDFADGYGLHGGATPADAESVPMVLRLSENVVEAEPSQIEYTFAYDASDPSQIQPTGLGTAEDPHVYAPAPGTLRLWKKPTGSTRTAADYVAPGVPLSAEELGLEPGGEVTLWVEAVKGVSAALPITATAQVVGGRWSGALTDVVHVGTSDLQVNVDTNRNGTITSDGTDLTSADNPFRFWLNDDSGGYDASVTGLGGGATDFIGEPTDSSSVKIGSDLGTDGDLDKLKEVFRRDLEDFAQIGLRVSESLWQLADRILVSIENSSSAQMGLRLWDSEYTRGQNAGTFLATRHVTDVSVADSIINETHNYLNEDANSFVRVDAGTPREFTPASFDQYFGVNPVSQNERQSQLMFEGINAGAGTLVFEFMQGDDSLAESEIYLDLRPVADLYEHHTVAYGPGVAADGTWSTSGTLIDPKTTPVETVPTLTSGNEARSFATSPDFLVFVHGWNMTAQARTSFAATAYKRLYWQNYHGTMGLFSWPTQVANNPVTDPGNFNRSEEIAWHSGAGLRNLLLNNQGVRQNGGQLAVIGHSMGGIVTSEALALAGNQNVADTVILTQAAASSEFYYGAATGEATKYYGAFNGQVGGSFPRFARLDDAATRMVNFNNEVDYALQLWVANTNGKPGGPTHNKPPQPGFGGARYDTIIGPPPVITRALPFGAPVTLQMGLDTYEMFAHGFHAPSFAYVYGAIGATDAAVGPFHASVNLRGAKYGFSNSRIDHSGQFNHSNVEMGNYWDEVMNQAGLD